MYTHRWPNWNQFNVKFSDVSLHHNRQCSQEVDLLLKLDVAKFMVLCAPLIFLVSLALPWMEAPEDVTRLHTVHSKLLTPCGFGSNILIPNYDTHSHCVSASVAICFGSMSSMLAILLFFDRATFLHLSTFWYIGIGMKRIWHQDDVTHCCVETMTLRSGFLLIWQWLWFKRDQRKKNR